VYSVPRNGAETIDDDRNIRSSTLESCLGMAGDCVPAVTPPACWTVSAA